MTGFDFLWFSKPKKDGEWGEKYLQLWKFLKENGHCRVPESGTFLPSALFRWLKQQKALLEGNREKTNTDRAKVRLLNIVEGLTEIFKA